MVDAAALRRSFGQVAAHGDDAPLFFYSWLFVRHPALRELFPPSMSAQRERLASAVARIVADIDDLDSLVPFVQQLGRDHRRFGVLPQHYPPFGEALLMTLEHFLGRAWTPDLAAEWTAAYGLVCDVMVAAATQQDEQPAWWDAEIVAHDQRRADLAVITVRPESELPYLPGQSISVQTAHRARLWRYYSPANAPRPDRTIELHVRAIDGGWVSSALVHSAGVGDRLRLGPAVGRLTLDADSTADILMIAGGTGLAPLRSIVEQLVAEPALRRPVQLYVEAGTEPELYDLPALDRIARDNFWLEVVPVVQQGRSTLAQTGCAAELALRQGDWTGHQVYLCGGPRMVEDTRDLLVRGGLEPRRLRRETFGYLSVPAAESNTVDLDAVDLDRAPADESLVMRGERR